MGTTVTHIEKQRTKKLRQGQSEQSTPLKQQDYQFWLTSLVRDLPQVQHKLNIQRNWQKPLELYVVDLNAGEGHNKVANCIGSPGTFMITMVRENFLKYRVRFCDLSQNALDTLKIYMKKHFSTQHCMQVYQYATDSAVLLRSMNMQAQRNAKTKRHIAESYYGLVLSDANNVKDVPYQELYTLSHLYDNLDISIHWNISATHRSRGKSVSRDKYPNLSKFVQSSYKAHWYIRGRVGKFIYLHGTNRESVSGIEDSGFLHINSPEGDKLFKELDKSQKEHKFLAANPGCSYDEYLKQKEQENV